MATLVFSVVGTLVGGPLGGAIGALIGQQIDHAIIGSPHREGPRLKELAVTTSTYGAALPRHFGRMRVAGTIIWSTDLIEHREQQGGGKGRASTTTYNYTASFAVALGSRPIGRIGRIWADGNLLRGAAGDMKTAGTFRFHSGARDQAPDPLIAASEGVGLCPAFRGTAYAVFEDLQLADFGNRIPTLSFEVFADEAAFSLAALFDDVLDGVDADLPLPGIAGMSCEGPLVEALVALDPAFPMDCDAGGDRLVLAPARLQFEAVALPEAAVSGTQGDFGGNHGSARKRSPEPARRTEILRYYDIDRDYQPGAQRAPGRPGPGQPQTIELPAALAADDARRIADEMARRTSWARQTLSWRSCHFDPQVTPGAIVSAPGVPGRWRVAAWEWRESGVELSLLRQGPSVASAPAADAGRSNAPPDTAVQPSQLFAFELPWDGIGAGDSPTIFAALSSSEPGWSGAALFVDHGDGGLVPLGPSGRTRSILGHTTQILAPASAGLLDRKSRVIVQLAGADLALVNATLRQLAMGANQALIGSEIVQFARAVSLGAGLWQLDHLLRGRGGTEAAVTGHQIGEAFVLLDGSSLALDSAAVGQAAQAQIAAVGLGDTVPVVSGIALRGTTLRPLTPVQPRAARLADGSLRLRWTRRSRGWWTWPDGVEAPLHEQQERYEVILGPTAAPIARWEVSEPQLILTSAALASLAGTGTGQRFYVRQIGSYALSDPLPHTTL